jgi:hypothetical protein
MRFHGVAPEGVADLVVAGLLHRSKWIVHLAAELGEHYLTAEQAAAVVPKVFAKAPDLGLAGAAYLAIHFLGKDAARELIVQRLKEPLNQGCMQLFHYLRKAWDPSLDARLGDLLRAPLFFEPWTAEACLELVQACAIEHRKALGPLLKEAYDHWLHNEEPYPKADGAIPPSPRGEILKVLIKLESVTPAELFSAASDERHEVARAGKEALVKLMAQSEDARKEMLARIGSGAPLEDLLRDALRDRVPFGTSELEVVVAMLSSPRAEVRHAAMGVLEPSYMDSAMSMALVENLVSDDAQPIRDRAHEKLADLKRSA